MIASQILHKDSAIDAYADNILIEACGVSLTPSEDRVPRSGV